MIQNRFKGLEKDRFHRSVKRLINIVEQEAGIGATNIDQRLEEFFESKLELKKKLHFDRDFEVDDFRKGRWVFRDE